MQSTLVTLAIGCLMWSAVHGERFKMAMIIFFHCEGKKLSGKPKVGHHAGYSVGLLGSERRLHIGGGKERKEEGKEEEEVEGQEDRSSASRSLRSNLHKAGGDST